MKYIIIIIIICFLSIIRNNNINISYINSGNYGNIIDRMIILYLLCEGDKEKFKKYKSKYYNEKIYSDEIFLFDFEYKFKISLYDKIILFILFYFHFPWLGSYFKLDSTKYMYKYVVFVINNYIKQNKIIEDNNIQNTICIHFRCSDGPFNRADKYELVTLKFYKEAINYALTKNKFNKIIFLSCNSHRGSINHINYNSINKVKKNENFCNTYLDKYINGLKKFNIPIEFKCGNISQDFYYLKNSGCSIITAGTFALYGAYASNNLLIMSENLKNNNFRDNIYIIKNKIIKHSQVEDYYDINEMNKHNNINS